MSEAKSNDTVSSFRRTVAECFGVLPNFFCSGAAAPGLIEELWAFAKSSYLDNPLPPLFKERLFVHLSRFCEVRYCIVRHVGFLIGQGRPAGDPAAAPDTIEQVISLLSRPIPDALALSEALSRLETYADIAEIPLPRTRAEADLFDALTIMFVAPRQSQRARHAVCAAVGDAKLEILTAFLAFVRTAHYWTETHPELAYEPDMVATMKEHPALAQLLLDPTEAELAHSSEALQATLAELRKTEQQLRDNEEWQRTLVASSPIAIVVIDPDAVVQLWNPAAEKLFGWTEDEVLGRRVPFIPDDRQPECLACRTETMKGKIFTLQTQRNRRDGSIVDIRMTAAPLLDTSGGIARILVLCEDDTERKRAEAALLESTERLRLATEAAHIGIFDWDLCRNELHWDERLRTIWSVPDGAHVTIDTFYAGLHPDDVARVREDVAASHDPCGTGEFETEYRVIGLADRQERYLVTRGLTKFQEGISIRMSGIAMDATALRNAKIVLARDKAELERIVSERTQELTEAQTQLAHAQRMEALGQLAGGIAHDFNNVLQAVQGRAALIERRPDDAERVRDHARTIVEAAERGSIVTQRLLAFSRRSLLQAEPVDAASVFAGLQDILSHTLGAGVAVRVAVEHGLRFLLADKRQLETVLINLATNARDAMRGMGTLTFAAGMDLVRDQEAAVPRAVALEPGAYVRLSVSDTGPGMTPEVLARASEPFFTTKGAGEGTGLGLAMARGFAEQSGGGFFIESTLGLGAVIKLWFPVARAAAPAAEREVGRGVTAPGETRVRMLLVDDDEIVRDTLAQELNAKGHTVLPAATGSEAILLLDTGEAVDVLISDLSMPGMDGLSVIREAQRRRPHLPAILLTGFATKAAEIALDAAASATFSVLRKPVSGKLLAERAAVMLAGATAPRR
jgi:PAS domain S-box-containing protein